MKLPWDSLTPGESGRVIALMGAPEAGKTALFAALTGKNTEETTWGTVVYRQRTFVFVDIAEAEKETEALDVGQADAVVAVCDGTCSEGGLVLAMQALERTERVVICINVPREGKERGVETDAAALSRRMGTPVVEISLETGEGLEQLMDAVELCCHPGGATGRRLPQCTPEERARRARRWAAECVRTEQPPAGRVTGLLSRLFG